MSLKDDVEQLPVHSRVMPDPADSRGMVATMPYEVREFLLKAANEIDVLKSRIEALENPNN